MFEIIMYLFENYIQVQALPVPDSNELVGELEMAGFKKTEIQKAFDWFAGFNDSREATIFFKHQSYNKMRYYTLDEKKKLGRRCLGLLAFLEQIGVIDPELREIIVDRAMAIEHKRIEIEQLKWITLMVLFHDLDKERDLEPDLTWIENLLFVEVSSQTLH